jgi:pimeloyl-ACP methyl ester carboxylesterase
MSENMPDADDESLNLVELPVGFEDFHRKRFLNYQFNRAHGLGFADRAELHRAAARVRSRDDGVVVLEELSRHAERDGRLHHAAGYQRLAVFFSRPGTHDHTARYQRYRQLFDGAVVDGGVITRHDVPYAGATLPAYRLAALRGPTVGTVLIHGGFDSLIEEFYAIWQRVAAAGFDVVAFDGPGQGGARIVAGLTFDHDWEQPVGAMLDHFGIDQADLVGMSMGGYWALRAAGLEPRVARVVAWPAVYDWLERVPSVLRPATRAMLAREHFMRWSVGVRTRLSPTLRQVIDQALYVVDSDDPIDAVNWFLGMNAEHLGSWRVTQEVLLMSGAGDVFQPPSLTRAQTKALTAARSVVVRTFTKGEHADQHCQIGNLALACDVLTDWLRCRAHASPTGI